jgi:hypothetical protein
LIEGASMFQNGQRLVLSYPTTSLVTVRDPGWKRRSVMVRSVRDLVSDPLTPWEFLRRPMIHRSRYLLRVIDLRQNQYRQMYLASAREWRRESPLRVGLFDGGRLVFPTSVEWGWSQNDRRGLAKVLRQWMGEDFGGMRLGVYADGLRLVCTDGPIEHWGDSA